MAYYFLQINFYSCIFLVGLIWTIQLVHYPSFNFVDKSKFSDFESFHSLRISWIVVPIMLTELVSSIITLFTIDKAHFNLFLVSVVLLLFIWLVTLFISSPIHTKLLSGYSQPLVDKLIATNWYRTILWSSRCILLYYIFKNY